MREVAIGEGDFARICRTAKASLASSSAPHPPPVPVQKTLGKLQATATKRAFYDALLDTTAAELPQPAAAAASEPPSDKTKPNDSSADASAADASTGASPRPLLGFCRHLLAAQRHVAEHALTLPQLRSPLDHPLTTPSAGAPRSLVAAVQGYLGDLPARALGK